MNKRVAWPRSLGLLVAATVVGATTIATGAQDESRQIWDSGFRQKRPPSTAPATTERREPEAAGPRYRPTAPVVATPRSWVVGFTVWRLRRAQGAETSPRLLVQDVGIPGPTEYVPERIAPGAALRIGDRVRLGIEVAQQGFLYIVDRERYADGSMGAPQLMFPSRSLSGADNRISPGRLIEIPGRTDPVPALRVERRDPRSIGDELVLIITPQPIPDLEVGTRETPLSAERVADWERRWAGNVVRLDLVTPQSIRDWTAAEQEAGNTQRLLTQDDPLPAALYYLSAGDEGGLVRIPLTFE